MKAGTILKTMQATRRSGARQIAVLVDPDKTSARAAHALAGQAAAAGIDYLMVGGSLIVDGQFDNCVEALKAGGEVPVVLFPGDTFQISDQADAILLLSLISGRNPELLIGRHVIAAPALRRSGLEILPTGYMLIDGGAPTSVSYMSNTMPIPADKPDIAMCTAMAGEMLGLRAIYMDAGSGALRPVSPGMIEAVRAVTELPLIVGGGLRSADAAIAALDAGADVIVTGTAVENDAGWIQELGARVRERFPAAVT